MCEVVGLLGPAGYWICGHLNQLLSLPVPLSYFHLWSEHSGGSRLVVVGRAAGSSALIA